MNSQETEWRDAPVFTARCSTTNDSTEVERTTDEFVTGRRDELCVTEQVTEADLPHTGQILGSSTTHKHNGMLLQVVALTLDVGHARLAG